MNDITPITCQLDPADRTKAVCTIEVAANHYSTTRASVLSDEWNGDDLNELGRHLAEHRLHEHRRGLPGKLGY